AQAAADAAAAREAANAAAEREATNSAKVAAELDAAKAAAAQAAADATAAREAANIAAAQEAAKVAKVAAELDAAKAAAVQAAADAAAAREAANIAVAQEAAKANAARDAAKAAAREAVAEDSLGVPSSLQAKRSIYYPTDKDAISEQDKRTVQAHAKYLAEHQNRSVRLEGNADERGSTEYNLALGQRRADGVRKMLLVGGVKESQIESVSYGEEKPTSTEHNETAWSQNRRTDINYNVK
ncbi:MAG: peptidoglycan-associated lipoprotein Pal, partial [Candidatus Nitrotoga sp.]